MTTTQPEASVPRSGPRPPTLADGVELIGEYEGSGYREPPSMARRGDGQVVQLSRLLFLVAAAIDGRRDEQAIADAVTSEFGKRVSADNVRFLLDQKLRPLGLVTLPDGTQPETSKADSPLLGLRYRAAVVPEGVVTGITRLFHPLFWPVVVLAVVAALAVFDAWFFFVHGVGQATRDALYDPLTLLLILGLVTVSAAFHECGHATGCAYGGAKPGVMGAGIYLVWPAFYTNVTDSYRLGRAGRLRTDLGGIYFNLIFVLLVGAAYAATGLEPLLLVVLAQHFEILRHFFPFVRLDGYYVVSDATGVPDLFSRIGPVLRSLRPGRAPEPAVTELKPWARAVITGWVLLVIPILLFNVALLLVHLPRIAATTWDSLFVQVDALRGALDGGGAAAIAVAGVRILTLVLPAAGAILIATRTAGAVVRRTVAATAGSPGLRAAVATGGVVVAAVGAWVLIPNGDYAPIQEGERLTYQEAALSVRHVGGGRPAWTQEREDELGATWQRDAAPADSPSPSPSPAGEGATENATATPSPDSSDADAVASPTSSSSEADDTTSSGDDETTSDTTSSDTSADTATEDATPDATSADVELTDEPTSTATSTATSSSDPDSTSVDAEPTESPS